MHGGLRLKTHGGLRLKTMHIIKALKGPYKAVKGSYMALEGPYKALEGPYKPYKALEGPNTWKNTNKKTLPPEKHFLMLFKKLCPQGTHFFQLLNCF